MKITLLEPLGIPEEVLARYQSCLEKRGHQFTAYGEKTTDPAELIRRTGESEIVILANNPYPAEVVEAAPNLKMLDVAFTGIDHVALDACKRKGVMLCNAAGYSTQCVAELAIGLTIACLRNMPDCETAVRTGAPWPRNWRVYCGHCGNRRHWNHDSPVVPGFWCQGYCLFPHGSSRGRGDGDFLCLLGNTDGAE